MVEATDEGDLIEVSLGADDGLQEGHQLEIYRNDQYVGRAIVRRTNPDAAVAEVLSPFGHSSARQGDRVMLKID